MQADCSSDEEAICTTQDASSLSVRLEHLSKLVGSLPLVRKLQAGPDKEESLPWTMSCGVKG